MKIQAKRIWKAFRDAGFTEDDEIVTHVATVLARHFGQFHTSIHLPLSRKTPSHIEHLIRSAFGGDNRKASQLLDSIVEARLSSKGETSQFASSKALRDILHLLLDVRPAHDLLDPACGTGWLLATRGPASGETVGFEISPLWAFIAELSCALRGLTASIHLDDVLKALTIGHNYDRIICNPPFGKEAPPKGWKWAFGGEKIHREAPFLECMTRALRTDEPGRAVTLVSDGLLLDTDNGSIAFRSHLTRSGYIRACISLPANILGGNSSVQCSVVVMGAGREQRTWLIDASQATPAGLKKFLATMEENLETKEYIPDDERITRIFSQREQQELVFEITHPPGNTQFMIFPRGRRRIFRAVSPLDEQDNPPLLNAREYCERGAVTMYADAQIIALAFDPNELASGKCPLVLRDILEPGEGPSTAPQDPRALIKALLAEQSKFQKELASLARTLEHRPERSMNLQALPERKPGKGLSDVQSKVWQTIETKMIDNGRPIEFEAAELQKLCRNLHRRHIQHALDMFEIMGLLVHVANKYRVTATSDVRGAS